MIARNWIVRNLANGISLLGVLPIAVLFFDDGSRYILPLIVFNNFMDDLDGIVAAKLNIKSEFGAVLDNICDAVAHTAFILTVGMYYGWICGIVGVAAVASMLIRIVSRIVPRAVVGVGSPTNELIRHMFFVLLLARVFSFDVAIVLAAVFTLHTVSMLLPYRMPGLIRSVTKSTFPICLVNVALVVAWLAPYAAPVVTAGFGFTYLYGFVSGGLEWFKADTSIKSNHIAATRH
jgi:phosphatidylserine synthase